MAFNIFNDVNTAGITVETKTQNIATNDFGVPLMKTGWQQVRVQVRCYRIGVSDPRDPYDQSYNEAYLDYYFGNRQCDYRYEWRYIPDNDRYGEDGRDGGGNGGSSGSFAGQINATDLKNHPKADCVYGKLSQKNSMKGVISEFAGENTNYDLDVKVEALEDGKNGNPRLGTTRANFNSSSPIEIVINSRYLNRVPNSIIAITFLHEALHAELLRKVRSIGGYGNLNKSNFPGIYDYWIRHGKDSQHEQMAAHYLNTLIDGIAAFDNHQKDRSYYKSLALKAGLEGTVTWNDLGSNRQDEADTDFDSEIEDGNYQCN